MGFGLSRLLLSAGDDVWGPTWVASRSRTRPKSPLGDVVAARSSVLGFFFKAMDSCGVSLYPYSMCLVGLDRVRV